MHRGHAHVRALPVDRVRTHAYRFIADGDQVVVEAKGDNVSKSGLRYDNDHCLVFPGAGGKIREVRGYCLSVLTETAPGKFRDALHDPSIRTVIMPAQSGRTSCAHHPRNF